MSYDPSAIKAELERVWRDSSMQQMNHRAGWGLRSDSELMQRGGYWGIKSVLVLRRGARIPGGSRRREASNFEPKG